MKDEQWRWQERGTVWKGIGIYHVTMTISSREPLLGKLVISDDDPAKAWVERAELGEAVVRTMFQIQDYHPEVKVLQFCLMPDHIHVVLHVTRQMKKGIGTVVRGWWQGAKKEGRKYASSVNPNTIRDNERSSLIEGKRETDNQRSHHIEQPREADNQQGSIDDGLSIPIFTEMPFIRPLSRRGQLQAMIRYVQMNPQRLATKRLKPGYFRVQREIEIAGRHYSGVGNIALLQAEQFMPVHVRRTMVEAAEHGEPTQLRNYMNGCVLAARKGIVMVSPFISPKEKEVLSVLLKEEHPIIMLADNGFGEYYKPSDALFDAVAAGRMLILSPWEHDDKKQHITREECVALNGMAEEICSLLL